MSEHDTCLREQSAAVLPGAAAVRSQTTLVAVAGATGHAGAEVLKILERHPHVRVVGAFSCEAFSLRSVLDVRPDVVFLATPDEVSAEVAPQLLDAGIRVVDLSGAFRLGEPSLYPSWYGFEHERPEVVGQAVYGLPEWCNGQLKKARLVANPGCHPTSVLLALRPLTYLIDRSQAVIVDCKSGGSNGELCGNLKACGVGHHRHEPEIRQGLHLGDRAALVFVPHLLPAIRGIYSTMYVGFTSPVTAEEVAQLYTDAYAEQPFVRVLAAGVFPELKDVVNTPCAEIGFALLQSGRRAVVVSVIDDLLKGAASQAVQNFNLMSGYDEREALL